MAVLSKGPISDNLYNLIIPQPSRKPGEVTTLGRPNYSFQKRQKELARKKKKELKRQQRSERNKNKQADEENPSPEEEDTEA
jgi:hypothetical protein